MTAYRRQTRRYQQKPKSITRKVPKLTATIPLLASGATLIVVFLTWNARIEVDFSLKVRSGLLVEAQVRPVELRK